MNNKSSIWLLAGVLLLSLSGSAANAQSFFFNPRLGFHIDNNDWRFRNPARFVDVRQSQFERRVAHLRSEIDFNMDRGLISRERAARLNDRLDDIANHERDIAGRGMLTDNELSRMEARLTNVEMAGRGSTFF
ncbi:MAG TPA: hypothetical protein V6D22_00435 [Candidatus Obscuribacterales bacterium]